MRRSVAFVLLSAFAIAGCSTHSDTQTASVLPQTHSHAAATAVTAATTASHIVYYNVGSNPNTDFNGFDILQGPDGNIYYTTLGPCSGNNCVSPGSVGKLDAASGAFTEIQLSSGPRGLVFTPDGALWAAELGVAKLARITPFTPGGVQEIPLPNTGGTNPGARSVTYGNDGSVWFTLQFQSKIGKIPASGPYTQAAVTTYSVPNGPPGTPQFRARPFGMVNGPDGNIWFTDLLNGMVYKSTTAGTMTGYITPLQKTYGATNTSSPFYISAGSDRRLYVTLGGGNGVNGYLQQLATWGTFGYLGIPLNGSPFLTRAGGSIVAYNDVNNDAIGMIDVASGAVREIPTAPAVNPGTTVPDGVAVASDGSVWFACFGPIPPGQHLCIGHLVQASTWSVFPATTITLERGKTNVNQLIGIAESGNSGPFKVTSSNPQVVTVSTVPHEDHNFVLNAVGYSRAFVFVTDAHGRTVRLIVTVQRT